MLRNFKTSWFGRFRNRMPYSATTTKIRDNAFFIVFIQYWIECIILYNTEWYYKNYKLIDYFDTCIIVLLLFDAFYNKRIYKYDDSNIIAFCIFVVIIILNLCFTFHFISQEHYFDIYKILLIVGAIFVGLLKIEKYKK